MNWTHRKNQPQFSDEELATINRQLNEETRLDLFKTKPLMSLLTSPRYRNTVLSVLFYMYPEVHLDTATMAALVIKFTNRHWNEGIRSFVARHPHLFNDRKRWFGRWEGATYHKRTTFQLSRHYTYVSWKNWHSKCDPGAVERWKKAYYIIIDALENKEEAR